MKFSSLNHIAIIMDGNRRWAEQKGLMKSYGHIKGVQSVKSVVKYCVNQKIPYLSLFAFSTENWKRKSIEVKALFTVIEKSLSQYESIFQEKKIKIHTIGDLSSLPESLKQAFINICERTKDNQGLNLILAVNYGGRREILDAMKTWGQSHSYSDPLTEEDFEKYLQSSRYPRPDLMIRTGGVRRISNFYLWNSAYSELYFSDLMWPEFGMEELKKAIDYYYSVKRRFGGT